jgi:carotenoid cleavage dioxygenase-like enzyme
MRRFPDSMAFQGVYEPIRLEAEKMALDYDGAIPQGLRGMFVRVQPDPNFPPFTGDDNIFNGDGAVTAFHFTDTGVDFRHRYVRTDRFKAERAAGRSLFGVYRNRFTDQPGVEHLSGGTANTNVILFRDKLLALKEDSLPVALDPYTLETEGSFDFGGQVTSQTFTAHPKTDPEDGTMHAFGYEARGPASRDMVYYEFSAEGKMLNEVWFEAPVAAGVHDFAVSKHYVMFPLWPLTVDLDRLKRGGLHFEFQPGEDLWYGILPRGGKASDVRWMRSPPGFQGHVVNAFDDNDHMIVDMPNANGNWLPFFPAADGFTTPPHELRAPLCRFAFDVKGKSGQVEIVKMAEVTEEMGRSDDRFAGLPYENAFILSFDASLPYDISRAGPPSIGLFNVLIHRNVSTGAEKRYWPGEVSSFQEPTFVPRGVGAPEGDGYILVIVNRLDSKTSDLVILDTADIGKGPVATIHIPIRMRMGIHGNWIAQDRLPSPK